jgi:hypothetical protein
MAGRSHARCASVIWLLQKSLLRPCPCRAAGSSARGHRIVFVARHEHADAPYAVALLRARRKRPRSYREASARELTWRVSPNRRRCRRGYLQGCGQRQAAWRGRRVDEREAIEKGAIEFKVPATKLITVQRR